MKAVQTESRRGFFRALLRYAGLGLLAGVGAAAASKRPDRECIRAGRCSGCPIGDDCPLNPSSRRSQ
ncbi:MAG: hypothetical protein R6V58_07925, partial [Planctomycetota bacterium]